MKALPGFLFALLALIAARPAAAAANPETARPAEIRSKIALVVGNSHYVNAAPLKNAANDGNDMCAAFRKLGFDVICRLDVGTKREFKDAIFEFTGKINPDTVAVFYFAGHGVQIDGVNYLIPTKAALRTKSDVEDESVQINYLMSELEGRKAALNLFFLDACRDNPFVDPLRGYVPLMGFASQFFAPRNSIIAMSTGTGQVSLDGDGRNGTFTKNLLQHLGTPNVPVEEMLKSVSLGTRADARKLARLQDPQVTSTYAERFCLAGCGGSGAAASGQETLKTRSAELARLEATINEAKARQAELEKKQEEMDQMRKTLAMQQASIEAKNKEIQLRSIQIQQQEKDGKNKNEKDKKDKPAPAGILPAF
jgi:uncharacterized caspase-like protein